MTRVAIPDEVVRWGERIDELKGLYGIATDAELAVYLCVSKQGLHNFRSGITRAPSVATRGDLGFGAFCGACPSQASSQ